MVSRRGHSRRHSLREDPPAGRFRGSREPHHGDWASVGSASTGVDNVRRPGARTGRVEDEDTGLPRVRRRPGQYRRSRDCRPRDPAETSRSDGLSFGRSRVPDECIEQRQPIRLNRCDGSGLRVSAWRWTIVGSRAFGRRITGIEWHSSFGISERNTASGVRSPDRTLPRASERAGVILGWAAGGIHVLNSISPARGVGTDVGDVEPVQPVPNVRRHAGPAPFYRAERCLLWLQPICRRGSGPTGSWVKRASSVREGR